MAGPTTHEVREAVCSPLYQPVWLNETHQIHNTNQINQLSAFLH